MNIYPINSTYLLCVGVGELLNIFRHPLIQYFPTCFTRPHARCFAILFLSLTFALRVCRNLTGVNRSWISPMRGYIPVTRRSRKRAARSYIDQQIYIFWNESQIIIRVAGRQYRTLLYICLYKYIYTYIIYNVCNLFGRASLHIQRNVSCRGMD